MTYKAYAADDGLGCTANGLTGTNLRVVYEVKTSTQIIPTIIASDPQNKMVKYASQGSCGRTLTAKLDSIVVRVTGSNLTVECPALGYKAGGTTNHTIGFSRYR